MTGWMDGTGWDFNFESAKIQHTLIEVKTEEALTGIGNVYPIKDTGRCLAAPFDAPPDR